MEKKRRLPILRVVEFGKEFERYFIEDEKAHVWGQKFGQSQCLAMVAGQSVCRASSLDAPNDFFARNSGSWLIPAPHVAPPPGFLNKCIEVRLGWLSSPKVHSAQPST